MEGYLLTQGEGGPKFRGREWEESLNQSLVNKYIVPTARRDNHSSNHTEGKQWDLVGSVSGLVISEHGKHP